MSLEKEVRVLNIDKDLIIQYLEKTGAKKVGTFFQRRLVYDFNPVNKNKWIRLRTNGKKTTLTIKEIFDRNSIDGTRELEIEVSDFDATNEILEELGYFARNYQENKRIIYLLSDIEFSIDTWPMIPTYLEIEGKTVTSIENILKTLHIDSKQVTTLDVASIYKEIYNIDIFTIDNLTFKEGNSMVKK